MHQNGVKPMRDSDFTGGGRRVVTAVVTNTGKRSMHHRVNGVAAATVVPAG
jgi:hypothetical protein